MSFSVFTASQGSNANMTTTKDLACLDVASSAKGQKTATIQRNGQPAYWTLSSSAQPLFQPSAFNATGGDASSSRLSLCLTVGSDVMAEAHLLDSWAIQYAFENGERLFGKPLTMEQVKDRYFPLVKVTDKYPAYLKIKVAVDRNAPTYWSVDKTKRGPPENWTLSRLLCNCKIASFLVHFFFAWTVGPIE